MLADCKYPSVKSTSSSKSKICTHRFWIFFKLESLSKNVCKQTGKVLEKERALFLEMAKNFTQRAFLRLCIIRLKVHFFVEKKSSKTYPKNNFWIGCQKLSLDQPVELPKTNFLVTKAVFWHPKAAFLAPKNCFLATQLVDLKMVLVIQSKIWFWTAFGRLFFGEESLKSSQCYM